MVQSLFMVACQSMLPLKIHNSNLSFRESIVAKRSVATCGGSAQIFRAMMQSLFKAACQSMLPLKILNRNLSFRGALPVCFQLQLQYSYHHKYAFYQYPCVHIDFHTSFDLFNNFSSQTKFTSIAKSLFLHNNFEVWWTIGI